jgi:hypothetical protein
MVAPTWSSFCTIKVQILRPLMPRSTVDLLVSFDPAVS